MIKIIIVTDISDIKQWVYLKKERSKPTHVLNSHAMKPYWRCGKQWQVIIAENEVAFQVKLSNITAYSVQ